MYFTEYSEIEYFVLSDLNRGGGDEGVEVVREVLNEFEQKGRKIHFILDACQSFGRKVTDLDAVQADVVLVSFQKMAEMQGTLDLLNHKNRNL